MITVSDFNAYRQLSGTNTARDARVQVFILAVIARAERYLRRTFASGTVAAEDHDWNSGGVYWLRRTPITSLTSVSLVDEQSNATTLGSDHYKYDATTGELHLYASRYGSALGWVLGLDGSDSDFRAVRFAYVGGNASCPADLKLALLQFVDSLFTANEYGQGVNRELTGASLGDMSFSFKSEEEMRLLERRYLLPFKTGGLR